MIDRKWIRLYLVLISLLINIVAYGQPGDPPPPNPPVPISGIEILLGAGALLGVKRLHTLRKPKS
jgi:hypothetical protein